MKYDAMRTGEQSLSEMAADALQHYPGPSDHARHICFVWMDGRKMFLNYSFLISVEYVPEPQAITLFFTSHTVVLHGIFLESLFQQLMLQTPKIIACCDERYNLLEGSEPVVNTIHCEKNT